MMNDEYRGIKIEKLLCAELCYLYDEVRLRSTKARLGTGFVMSRGRIIGARCILPTTCTGTNYQVHTNTYSKYK